MIYADTNFFTNILVEMPHSAEAGSLLGVSDEPLPVTWLHRFEVVNAIQQCVFLARHGMQQLRITPEFALAAEASFIEAVTLGVWCCPMDVQIAELETVFQDIAHRHTAKEGFRTYDILHVSSALVLGCDTFWSFDAKAKRLAKLEGLKVNG
ncbi:MAG: type II toxin-antitoxin system VapC family toxin [Chthoniobacteraceae bacterium]